MERKKKLSLKEYLVFSPKDIGLSALILLSITGVCFMLKEVGEGGEYVPMIYILGVFLVSRYTDGYFFGLAASVLSVIAVNYFFTYPYYEFNVTLSGYPLAIAAMISVAIITSAMTTQIKEQSRVSVEAAQEKTRSNLLRAMSHDLRTPLTSILGACSAIEDNYDVLLKEERLELLRGVREEAQWLIRMVENLLSVTRIGGANEGTRIIKVPEAVEEITAEAVTKLKKRFPDERVSVKVPGELLLVPMDAMLIEQVLINLMENAVLHGEYVTLIELNVQQLGKSAVFEVVDNGCGIDRGQLPGLFDGKSKAIGGDNGDNRRSMGIGLSVCSTIVAAHGGTLTAGNVPGGGAVFRFTLPLEGEGNGN